MPAYNVPKEASNARESVESNSSTKAPSVANEMVLSSTSPELLSELSELLSELSELLSELSELLSLLLSLLLSELLSELLSLLLSELLSELLELLLVPGVGVGVGVGINRSQAAIPAARLAVQSKLNTANKVFFMIISPIE